MTRNSQHDELVLLDTNSNENALSLSILTLDQYKVNKVSGVCY
jgi:hypothetical protein